MQTVLRIGFGEALDKAIGRSSLSIGERFRMRRTVDGHWVSCLRDAAATYAAKDSAFSGAPLEEEGDSPFLDWLYKLLESGKLAEFMQFLVTDFLPKLFDAILKFIQAISAI